MEAIECQQAQATQAAPQVKGVSMSNMGIDLLSLWWSIGWEAMELCDTVERLPDVCACGDAEAHLEGRCRCCNRHRPIEEGPEREENCSAIIARLRTDLRILANEFKSTAGPVEALALVKGDVELRRGIFLTPNDLQQVLVVFARITESVAGFRMNCSITQMQRMKRYCVELKEACRRINRELLGEEKDEGSNGNRPGLPHAA